MSENIESELKAAGPNGRVVPTHSTAVDKTSSWDRTLQFRKMRSPATPAYFDEIFAFQIPNTEGDRKTHYSFIHHYVNENGEPGAASMRALSNSVAVLNGGRGGTVLRGAAREGVYRHIAAHYRDAEMEAPELKSDEDVDAIMMFKGLIDAPLTETLDLTVKGLQDLDNIIDTDSSVVWTDGDQEIKGIVIEADDDTALVEELNEKGERTGEFYELDYAEIKLRTFVVMEKVDQEAEVGSIVSWETSMGRYYGDVIAVETEGSLRGEPQGLELEGSEENPVYLVRVWMQEMEEEEDEPEDEMEDEDQMEESSAKSAKSAGEWTPTNVTVVARGGALRVEEALPTADTEEDYDGESEDEETPMKSIDPEFRAQVKRVIEQNSEILARLAQFDAEEKSAEVAEEVAAEETEVKADDAVTMEAALEEQKADMEIETEVKSEEAVAEVAAEETEVKSEEASEEVAAEEAPAAEEVVEEKASISFDELKEFHLLLKEFNK